LFQILKDALERNCVAVTNKCYQKLFLGIKQQRQAYRLTTKGMVA
jgi:hypothetical protein